MSEFHYEKPFPLGEDKTDYRLVSDKHVEVVEFEGKEILKVNPAALTLLANEAVSGYFVHAPPFASEAGGGDSR